MYIARVNRANSIGRSIPFRHIEFVPTELLHIDRSNGLVIEKVYHGPSIKDVLAAKNYADLAKISLFGAELGQKMGRKRIPFEDLAEAVQLAYDDVLVLNDKAAFDKNGGNAVVLDYNPAAQKVKVVLVDHLEE